MSDKIEVGAQASGEEGINRLVSAVERLEAALSSLATNNSPLAQMQAQMKNGFTEMAELAKSGGEKIRSAAKKNSDDTERDLEAARDRQLNADRVFAQAKQAMQTRQLEADVAFGQALKKQSDKRTEDALNAAARLKEASEGKSWQNFLDIDSKKTADAEAAAARMRSLDEASAASSWRNYIELESKKAGAAEQLAARVRALDESSAAASFRNFLDLETKKAAAAEQLAARTLHLSEAANAASWASFLDLEAKKVAAEASRYARQNALDEASAARSFQNFLDLEAKKLATAERQRVLNTGYLTSSLQGRIGTATQAQTYAGLGGDAAARYGSEAASASLADLHRQLAAIPAAARASSAAIVEHNSILNEGHSLARGLAGSLGGLWLTYGSLVPLAAGAALAASLSHVVTVGKEVENQLNFVFALSSNREGVNLDQFLKINDSSLHSIVEAANATRALAQNGLSASQSMQVLPSILDLATVGEMTVGQAALAATGAVSAFGLSFSEAGRVGDIFAKTAAESNTSVLAITESMKQASTVASLFKVTIEETAGVLGVLAKINITGGAAGTSMTNMLTGLYEPTEKGKKALKELGIETQTTSGALKPFTQLMEELRGSLSSFNDSAKVDLLGSIFTVRGVKAVQQVQESLGEYKKKVEEAATATGFMRSVVMQLENSTDGAFKRLGVSVERTLVTAFKDATPYVQQIGLHLADAFKDGSATQVGLTNLATNVARLTGGILDGLPAATALGAAYLGFRALGPLVALFNAATTATAASAVAQAAATATSIAHTSALAGGASTLALMTAATEAQTVATAASTAASVAWGAVLLPALAAVAVALAGAAALWLLFRDNTDAADQANTKLSNSLHVITEQLDKEIERLEKSESLWNAREGRFNKEGAVTPKQLEQAGTNVKAVEARIRASGADPDKVRNAEVTIDPGTGMSSVSYVHSLGAALAAADANLAGFVEQDRRYNATVKPKTANENVRKATDSLGLDIEKFASKSSETNSKGELYQQNEAIRTLYRQAGALKQELIDPIKIFKDPEQEAKRIDGIRTSLKQLNDQVNAAQSGRAPKEDKKAANDALKADLEGSQLKLELAKMDRQMEANSLVQQNKRGEIGDLQLINAQLAAKLELNKQAVDIAKQQYELVRASDKEPKKAALQKYDSARQKAEKQNTLDTSAADELRQSLENKMDQEDLKSQATVLTEKGKLVQAFLVNYELQYRSAIEKTQNDMLNSDDATFKASAQRRLDYYREIQDSGVAGSRFKEAKQSFDGVMAQMQEEMATAKASAAVDGGISGALGIAAAADQVRNDLLPAAQAALVLLNAAARSSDAPALVEAANKAGAALAGVTKGLAKDAQPFGDAWGKIWKDVEGAAHSAWMSIGQGGVSALDRIAKVLKTGILDMIYQLTVKRWMMNIGASVSSTLTGGAGGAVDSAGKLVSAGGTMSEVSSLLSGTSAALTIGGSSTVAGFLSGLGAASGAAGTGDAAMLAWATATGNLSAGATAGAALGSTGAGAAVGGGMASISAALAAIPVWGWAALAAGAAIYAFGGSGPEDHTRLNFASNNTAGNISINERGNEGKNDSYIAGASGKSAFGTFGVSSTFWMDAAQPVVKDFVKTVSQTDDALAAFMTATEKASVSDYLTGKVSIANTGHEGANPNANGELDGVFKERIHNIMEGLGAGLSALTDSFSGTSAELATETGKILQFRQALVNGGEAVFGMKVALEDVAALKLPTEATSVALTRITQVFATTNQVAQITGKTVEQMFGALGLASFKARDDLVQAAGGLDSLTKKVSSYSANFITKTDQTAQNLAAVTKTMTELGLGSVTTKVAFAKVVSSLDLVHNAADVKLFNSLMDVQQAFSDVASIAESAATGLQDQLDQLTMTRIQLIEKERAALDPSNRALYDQLQVQKKLADAKADVATAYDNEVTAIKSANERLVTFGAGLRTFRDGLLLGSSSPLTPAQKYAEARNQFDTTLAKARGGDTKAQDALQNAASAFVDASRVANASGGNFTSDFDRVTSAMTEMSSWADSQVDTGKASLEQLRLQVSALTDIKAAVLTLPEAIKVLMDGQSLNGIYQDVLGRAPDMGGFEFWQAQMKGGLSASGVANEMRHSPEYMASHVNQADAAATAAAASAAALKAMSEQLAMMRAELAAQTGAQVDAAFASTAAAAKVVADSNVQAAQEAAWAKENKVEIV